MEEEKNIIKGCKQRKQKSQMDLFRKYAPTLKTICLRYVNNDFDADEIMQEGFIKIFNNIHKYKNTGSFLSWMKRIMANTAIDHCRKVNKLNICELDVENQDYTSENEDSFINIIEEANISQKQIIDSINNLPNGYRLVFNLYVFESFTHKEIAERLDISINTSKTQLWQARKKLQKEILKLVKKN